MRTITALSLSLTTAMLGAAEIHVSPTGHDTADGSAAAPVASLQQALHLSRANNGADTIIVGDGTYHLASALELSAADAGLTITAADDGNGVRPLLTGSVVLSPTWREHGNGIYATAVPAGTDFNQYVRITAGTHRSDKEQWIDIDPQTFSDKTWSDPTTGVVHAFQTHKWGNLQYPIARFDVEQSRIHLGPGGQQLQRRHGFGKGFRGQPMYFIDNIFEELDAPAEWFLDRSSNTLYFMPPVGADLTTAVIEGTTSAELIRCVGADADNVVNDITINGLAFGRTSTTYLAEYYNVTRSDWAIHRGAVIYARNARAMTIDDCTFAHVGSNAVFFDGHNRNHQVRASHFQHIGESAVAIVGRPESLRMYLDWDSNDLHKRKWEDQTKDLDMGVGPKSEDYPADCLVQDCVMHDLGIWGKQVAGVFISTAARITVDHCSIFDVPRAGICVGDGSWGGHVISHNDIWNTVRETSDHGPFNSWGRDRFWKTSFKGDNREMVLKDAVETVEIHHNRIANWWREGETAHWTIDLDDGSSNYNIHHNLSLGATIKLRDGYFRHLHNNIQISPISLGWHLWFDDSGDIFERNITVLSGTRMNNGGTPTPQMIRSVQMGEHPWGERHDHNLWWNMGTDAPLFSKEGMTWDEWRAVGNGAHSVIGDPLFVDPANGDFRLRENSPALALGFENFPMDDFG
ncbi:MAG: right-handed parallel beta-helix repeat-containing protein, partial [Planctomycetota bacterium]